ncbi:caspase family protein [Dactylosporangium cerinum]|uniref:Caspase family protein n=1 Tax=Dactylosporangium cerinum TaxID=1434730 RepID=A0ABV9W9T0_9ACTN
MTRLVARAEPGNPGLFVNPDWQPGTPGAFAVVIGVSDYPYLRDGSGWHPGDETFGLGQLYVSAATATAFFEWFSDKYDFQGTPPARCWLLLSPTAEERAASAAAVGSAPATLENCELALQAWYAAMESNGAATADSRGYFFFSGHGLEVSLDAQILLPSDYLRGPGRAVNNAISTDNLLKGLASSPVPQHYLFADACRNDVASLRQYVVQGRPILNVRAAGAANPDVLTGILYAAASGTIAWQPFKLSDGLSLFGRALIDGLRGLAGVELQGCNAGRCEVRFNPLQTYLKNRVTQLLADFGSPEKARIRQGGSPPDVGVTVVVDSRSPFESLTGPAPVGQVLAARYDVTEVGLSWTPADGEVSAHRIFGSEHMSEIWMRHVHASDLRTGASALVVVREVHRSDNTQAYRVVLELPPAPDGHWLCLDDPGRGGRRFAVALPDDSMTAPLYELTMDFEFDDSGIRWISAVEARLALSNRSRLGELARMWSRYELANAADAAHELDTSGLLQMVFDKVKSPLAATVAATLLFRARRYDLLPVSWLANLTTWFMWNTDAAVLWAAHPDYRREVDPDRLPLLELKLPYLAEVLQMAWRLLSDLGPDDDPPWRLQAQVHRAMSVHRPGGLFAVYSGPAQDLGSDLVRPRRQR